jgi:hypothetical protein
MDFRKNLEDKMKEKGLSDSSIKNYIRHIEILNDDKDFKNLNFLKKKEDIMNKIKEKKLNTQKSYIISVVSSLKVIEADKKNKKLFEYYYDEMMNMNKEIREETNKNEKTESQKKNWIDMDEIKNKLDDLKNKALKYTKKINEKEYNEVLKMVVLSLYALTQPRRNADYQYMDIVLDKVPDDNINFLVYKKKQFWFRKYKTAKSELKKSGETELKIDIKDDLMENIDLYLKHHPLLKGKKITTTTQIPFLVNYMGEPLHSVNSITYIMNRIFKKNVGSSMMRHIYLSNKYGDELKEMQEDSKNMSHSISQQKDYVKK